MPRDEVLTVKSGIHNLAQRNTRFALEGYGFVLESLDYTRKTLKRKGHVSGRELLEGVRSFALAQYGPMAKVVLNYWNIFCTDDIGEMVFDLIDVGLLKRRDEDRREDFIRVFDFDTVFEEQFCASDEANEG